jgi:hypothetical protein
MHDMSFKTLQCVRKATTFDKPITMTTLSSILYLCLTFLCSLIIQHAGCIKPDTHIDNNYCHNNKHHTDAEKI